MTAQSRKVSPTGPQSALRKLGLVRDIDLALHLPLRYEDETRISCLAAARDGDHVQIQATVTASEVTLRPRRQLLVRVDDGSAVCTLRFFAFSPALRKVLTVGSAVLARGELKGGIFGWTMMHPVIRPTGADLPTTLTPIYPTVAALPQTYLGKVVAGGLRRADLTDTIPADLLEAICREPVWNLHRALYFLHHPAADVALTTLAERSHPAWERLKLEELLAQQLSQIQSRRERAALCAPVLRSIRPHLILPGDVAGGGTQSLCERFLCSLPFSLTAAQCRVVSEIAKDIAQSVPMHRLLQGDVGAGKTVVAAVAATICIEAGAQCALMAPTEILAQQHFGKLVGWLEPLGVKTAWLNGSQKAKERRQMLALVESGEAALVVGTHALIQDKVQFKQLALAIIDEQHRFGVSQRLALRQKTGHDDGQGQEPHFLMMTATPIPRTLAMSYYADLDVSTIDELPPGRTPIVTKLVNESRRDEVIQRIRVQVAHGRQVYWVCPLIEESEALDLSNATETHVQLSAALPGVMVGLVHSRMATPDKHAAMALFAQGRMGVLVSTTVIEVGVDVSNASLMVIEHAERFGLSQLHQLRGRVGRGAAASACVLLYSTGEATRLSEAARARLIAMQETGDGFEIARRDLEIRGPGEFLGARQSGSAMLRFADITTDTHLLDWARKTAPLLLDHHPELAEKHVARWYGGKSEFLKA